MVFIFSKQIECSSLSFAFRGFFRAEWEVGICGQVIHGSRMPMSLPSISKYTPEPSIDVVSILPLWFKSNVSGGGRENNSKVEGLRKEIKVHRRIDLADH